MTKKEQFFKFAKEITLLRFEIEFEKDSILEGERNNDEYRIQFCKDRIESKVGQIEGILRLAKSFNLNVDDLNLLSLNMISSFNHEDVYEMKEDPFRRRTQAIPA